ncbi:outer membrane lipoprotein-sorting protein [Prolixibacteraceae bacterium JC049]|nr:outer membrane lipoprotein-sorting protein [Prolixibacteraceae bacterium JC049]
MLLTINVNGQQLTGRDIIQKVKDRPDGDTRYSEMKMELINKRNRVRIRKVKSYSIDIGKDKKTIMFFLYPGDVKGTGFLTWDYDKIEKDDDKWLYLPAMKKTRRISGTSAKKDYFMGTDFTYDDMGSRNVDEDLHKLTGEETVNDQKCWVVESIPKDKKDIYSKKIAWIRQDCLVAVKVEYYDKLDKLHRKLLLSGINKISGFWIAQKLHMTNVQTKHQTILTISKPQYDIDLKEERFIVANLSRGGF